MRLIPQSMVARTVLVLLVGILGSHLISMGFYAFDRSSLLRSTHERELAEKLAGVISLIVERPAPERSDLVRTLGRTGGIRMRLGRDSILAEDQSKNDPFLGGFAEALAAELPDIPRDRIRLGLIGDDVRPFARPGAAGQMTHMTGPEAHLRQSFPRIALSVGLNDGTWINAVAPSFAPRPIWSSRFFLPGLLGMVVVVVICLWAVWRATRPLEAFAQAAERLGRDVNAPPLEEAGPAEMRRAAQAFNEMQRRLQVFIRDRTQVLAAISHDLRTPITRLRLRAEFVEDPEQAAKMLADLEEMEQMIGATLAFARDDAAEEPTGPVDLGALLAGLCADRAEARYLGPEAFEFVGRPLALKRAFANLIDNAIKYGDAARVDLQSDAGFAVITVDDDGPGISEAHRDRVFDPFYRVEGSRSRQTGGTGLGLSVVRSVVRAHGGEISLINRAPKENRPAAEGKPGGLRVMVRLPGVTAA